MNYRITSAALALCLTASPALAHTGAGQIHGFTSGLTHPFGGLDHILVMVAVGLWAACIGGRSLWAIPASFLGAMIIGAVLGTQAVGLSIVELGIAGSIVVMGALIAFRVQMSVLMGMIVAGSFALLHGHAHGAEMANGTNSFAYGLGFCIATAMLHALGLAASSWARPNIMRWSGVAISAAGFALLATG